MYGAIQAWAAKEKEIHRKALELCRDQGLQFNLAPIIELVRIADSYGFDVVRRSSSAGAGRDE